MTKRITISTLDAMKSSGDKFVMITAYDATFARLASEAGAETILVGDSLGMVLQGHETTIPVSLDAMVYHTECVARAKPRSLIVADLPFMSFSNSDDALHASTQLMQVRRPDGEAGGRNLAQRQHSSGWSSGAFPFARTLG